MLVRCLCSMHFTTPLFVFVARKATPSVRKESSCVRAGSGLLRANDRGALLALLTFFLAKGDGRLGCIRERASAFQLSVEDQSIPHTSSRLIIP